MSYYVGPRPYAILYTPYGGGWDVGIPLIGPRPYPMLFDPVGVVPSTLIRYSQPPQPNGDGIAQLAVVII